MRASIIGRQQRGHVLVRNFPRRVKKGCTSSALATALYGHCLTPSRDFPFSTRACEGEHSGERDHQRERETYVSESHLESSSSRNETRVQHDVSHDVKSILRGSVKESRRVCLTWRFLSTSLMTSFDGPRRQTVQAVVEGDVT